MLDFRVETFLCVCKHMNFTRAAEELNLTQPAVSQHIRYLEQYYQARLFHYQNRVLTLTDQGQYLKTVMETLHHDTARIQDAVQLVQKPKSLHIGATRSIGDYYLPRGLSAFLDAHPELNLSVTVANTSNLLPMLDSGAVDFLLCEGYFSKSEYSHQLIQRERMCVFCAANYDTSDITDLESLFRHPVLLRERGSGTREIFERYLRENGYSLDHFVRRNSFTSPHIILEMLLAGQGISVLYRVVGAAQLAEGTLKEIRLPGFQVSHEFNAIWQKNSIFDDYYRGIINELIQHCDAASP